MKTALLIFVAVGVLGFVWFLYIFIGAIIRTQANVGYKIEDQKVFYVSVAGGALSNTSKEVVGADHETFHELEKKSLYGKDKNFVYLEELKVEGADPKTFKNIDQTVWSVDNKHVFFANRIVKDADPKTFEVIDVANRTVNFIRSSADFAPYARDKKRVFYYDKIVEGADPETFRASCIDGDYDTYGFDKNSVYFLGQMILNSDSQSFSFIKEDTRFSKDKKQVYYNFKPLIDADPNDFKIFSPYKYSRSKNKIYYLEVVITDADANSFKVLNENMAKDNKFIFSNGVKQPQIDYSSFVPDKKWGGKDKNGPIEIKSLVK